MLVSCSGVMTRGSWVMMTGMRVNVRMRMVIPESRVVMSTVRVTQQPTVYVPSC